MEKRVIKKYVEKRRVEMVMIYIVGLFERSERSFSWWPNVWFFFLCFWPLQYIPLFYSHSLLPLPFSKSSVQYFSPKLFNIPFPKTLILQNQIYNHTFHQLYSYIILYSIYLKLSSKTQSSVETIDYVGDSAY